MKIKTVIFDVINVLVDYMWMPWALEKYGKENRSIICDAFWGHGNWDGLDLGTVSEEEFLEKCYALYPDHKELLKEAFYDCGTCAYQYTYVKDWISELKRKGYQVLYLSNYPDFLIRVRPDMIDFIPMMDGGVFSCYAHLIKPDSKIYAHICEKYQLNPEECLFIDDTLRNVEAAKDFGLHAIHFKGYEKTYPEIMEYLEKQN